MDFAYSQINDSELTIRVRQAGIFIAKVLAIIAEVFQFIIIFIRWNCTFMLCQLISIQLICKKNLYGQPSKIVYRCYSLIILKIIIIIIIGTEISKPYNHLENLRTQWIAATNAEPPELPHSAKQRIWDRPLLERVMDEMADSLPSASDHARWRAVTAPHAGEWLLAMPTASCGLKLDDEAVRVAVGLRLGTNLCEPHICV